ncbi:uncharacterized protein A4U43_C01F30630 [Asparagus officinalis]|uniref:Uncharacterized protein n=1 Tax=Asparagus officinalis TaxID=4686 RepID=A0A5P1FTM4_ASPOF|nr:uncharacterized protein A4U43_C01F30630 [Asparagus officinalis]
MDQGPSGLTEQVQVDSAEEQQPTVLACRQGAYRDFERGRRASNAPSRIFGRRGRRGARGQLLLAFPPLGFEVRPQILGEVQGHVNWSAAVPLFTQEGVPRGRQVHRGGTSRQRELGFRVNDCASLSCSTIRPPKG